MGVWKVLRTVLLLTALLAALFAFFWGVPLYRYLKTPAALSAAQTPNAPHEMNPRSLLGVSAATIPKFEGLVMRAAPDSAEAWIGLGILYQYKNLLSEAERCYLRAIEIDAEQAEAHYRLATVYQISDRPRDAVAEYRAALRAQPEHLSSNYSLAAVYQAQGKLEEAAWLYREILRMRPREYQAHNNLAIVREAQGRYKEAVEEYVKAAAIEPNDPVVSGNLESARRELGAEARRDTISA